MTNTKCNTSVFKILFKYPYFREYLNTISKYRSRYLNIIKNTWIFEYLTTLSVQYECQTRTKRAIIALQNSTTYTNAQNFFFVGGSLILVPPLTRIDANAPIPEEENDRDNLHIAHGEITVQ